MNARNNNVQEISMSLSFILLIVLILLLIGALPSWGYSRGWGYWPSGGLGLVVLILVILVLMGRI
jgi:membrane protein YdbS with pleckstrin-like domain